MTRTVYILLRMLEQGVENADTDEVTALALVKKYDELLRQAYRNEYDEEKRKTALKEKENDG